MEVYEKIKASKVTIKDFSRHIADYLDLEWDEAYYQRMRDIIKGERSTVTDAERRAIAYWEYTLDNPFEASMCGFHMKEINAEKKIDRLQKFILTGNSNSVLTRKIVKQLKDKLPN